MLIAAGSLHKYCRRLALLAASGIQKLRMQVEQSTQDPFGCRLSFSCFPHSTPLLTATSAVRVPLQSTFRPANFADSGIPVVETKIAEIYLEPTCGKVNSVDRVDSYA